MILPNAIGEPAKLGTIFALTDLDSGEVRYVGQTRKTWERYGAHLTMMQGSEWMPDSNKPYGPLRESIMTRRNCVPRENSTT